MIIVNIQFKLLSPTMWTSLFDFSLWKLKYKHLDYSTRKCSVKIMINKIVKEAWDSITETILMISVVLTMNHVSRRNTDK